MALGYELQLSTSLKPTRAMELLSRSIGGLTLTWNGKNSDYLLGPTIEIDVGEPLGRRQETIRDMYRLFPTLEVGFRFTNNTDHDISSQIMFQATMLLLEQSQDAILLFNGERTVLQRRNGQLAFNSDYHMWDEEWLESRLSIPFEHRPLPSPLL
jgi:hypothetical protein